MNFSIMLKVAMLRLGVNKADLSRSTGYSYSYISDLFKGRRRWNEESLDKVCKALGVEIKIAHSDESRS
ncbi:helix-turn-helix transcriptional regulator [Paenibacillus sp. Marseille-Q4541]|uniref:helix-turn-helix domain-containing protein n=1 Tax=Paenibacillus sp. Marseille-Q4541 TaxID=2831522 RepID=UPI001BA456DD